MTGAAEMRRVMAHAAEHIETSLKTDGGMRPPTTLALGYAKGVLDLLGTYLIDAEPEPGADELTPHLLDGDGDMWDRVSGADTWRQSSTDGTGEELGMDEIGRRYHGVRQVWVR